MASRIIWTRWLRLYWWRPQFEPRWRAWFFTDGPSPSRPQIYYPPCYACRRDYHKKWIARFETPWLVLEVGLGYAHGR